MPQSSQTTPNDTFDLAAVIAAGQSTSNEIDLGGVDPCGFFIPAGFAGATLSFLAAPASGSNGGIFVPVRDGNGAIYTVTVNAASYVVLPDPIVLMGLRWIRLVSGATETAERTILFAARPL